MLVWRILYQASFFIQLLEYEMKNNLIASAIVALGLAASGSASAIVVGGVNFGAQGLTNHLETTTLAETFVNGVGQTVRGYGQVNTVNGLLNYAGANRLYFTFSYNVNTFSPTAVTFNNGVVNVYLRSEIANLLNQASDGVGGNIDLIDNGQLWAVFNGHNSDVVGEELKAVGVLTGADFNFLGAGLLDSVGGLAEVQAFFDSNAIADGLGGFADINLTTSGSNQTLNSNDNLAGCNAPGAGQVGQWCVAGSAALAGPTEVPEPSVLSLLGLGLLGLGASTMRKRKAA